MRRFSSTLVLTSALILACGTAHAEDPKKPETGEASRSVASSGDKPNDLLNAALWQQESVEAKANAIGIYSFARSRLDDALNSKSDSALDQQNAEDLPPAVILDVDETVLDNSAYESGLVTENADYSSQTWDEWTKAEEAKPIPGSLDYLKYADSKGVKIFYVTNREAGQEDATRANMKALGYPMGGNVDTFLMKGEKPEWKSDKTPRREFVAKDYRVVALFGDNLGDFSNKSDGSAEERMAAFEQMKGHFSKDWFMLANPTYGSWESSAFGNDYKLPTERKRAMKIDALEPWVPSKQ